MHIGQTFCDLCGDKIILQESFQEKREDTYGYIDITLGSFSRKSLFLYIVCKQCRGQAIEHFHKMMPQAKEEAKKKMKEIIADEGLDNKTL